MIKSFTFCFIAIFSILFGITSINTESKLPKKEILEIKYVDVDYITKKAELELILNRKKRHSSKTLENLEIANNNIEYASITASKISR